jgi:hypothetical protein
MYKIICTESPLKKTASYYSMVRQGENTMYAIKAIYDGNSFQPEEPVPVKGKYEVVITFTRPINISQEGILEYFNTWDDEDVKTIEKIIEERADFSLDRDEV